MRSIRTTSWLLQGASSFDIEDGSVWQTLVAQMTAQTFSFICSDFYVHMGLCEILAVTDNSINRDILATYK